MASDNLSNKETTHIYEYDTVRALLTLLVVIGHSAYYTIMTAYGGVDYLTAMRNNGVADAYAHQMILDRITGLIYLFHMPMFMALSGAIFFSQYQKGKYRDFRAFMGNKAKRLLLPFLFAVLFFDIPLKYLGGYWDHSTNILTDIIIGQIFLQGSNHLWFLVVCFIEMICFQRLFSCSLWSKYKIPMIILLVAIYWYVKLSPTYPMLAIIIEYMIWFLLGMVFERFRSSVNAFTGWKRFTAFTTSTLLWLGCFLLFCLALCPPNLVPYVAFLAAIAGMMSVYIACFWLTEHLPGNLLINKLSNLSLGIYLFSDPLNYVLLAGFTAIVDITGFANNGYALGLYFLRIVGQLSAGILITILIRRFNVLKI